MTRGPLNDTLLPSDVIYPDAVPARVLDAIELCANALEQAAVCFGHGTDNAWDEAVLLVLSRLGVRADTADADVAQHAVTQAQWQRISRLLRQRILSRQPLPYLLGEAWFARLRFICDARALVPRSPLAELVLNHYQPWYAGPPPRRLLDLCCGGGSIGIAAAVYGPELEVTLADLDAAALALANENVALHGVGARVRCVQSDLFAALDEQQFDIILCNPPYVDARDLASMPEEYHAEPELALGAGEDGLDLARRILAEARDHLLPHGLLLLEVGNSWSALERAFPRVPFTWVELSAGGHGVLVMQAAELDACAQYLQSGTDAG